MKTTSTRLASFLDHFGGPLRLSLEALAACVAADEAAWKANGEPTDGTMNRLQHATTEAIRLAVADCMEACLAAGITVGRATDIVAELRVLADARTIANEGA